MDILRSMQENDAFRLIPAEYVDAIVLWGTVIGVFLGYVFWGY